MKSIDNLTFLKLGGSLITDKDKTFAIREKIINRIANEIISALAANPSLQLLIGHGSGSFGHLVASKHGTIHGVHTQNEWAGFYEVYYAARTLHLKFFDIFQEVGLKCISFPPSSMVVSDNRLIVHWNIKPIERAVSAGLIPVIYGDVIFDRAINGTILSTEELFRYLALHLKPKKILNAGIEEGVYKNFPLRTGIIPVIDHKNIHKYSIVIDKSDSIDVTGGMKNKIQTMLNMIENNHNLEGMIFSGKEPNYISRALSGEAIGTLLKY